MKPSCPCRGCAIAFQEGREAGLEEAKAAMLGEGVMMEGNVTMNRADHFDECYLSMRCEGTLEHVEGPRGPNDYGKKCARCGDHCICEKLASVHDKTWWEALDVAWEKLRGIQIKGAGNDGSGALTAFEYRREVHSILTQLRAEFQ